ncbi:MAG: hypothetical protein WD851_00480 [Pirellulales bacterium]
MLSIVGMTTSATAATVWIDLQVDSAGTFQLLLQASEWDNFGIASYGVSLGGGIQNLNHLSPRATNATGTAGEGPAGFTLLRSRNDEFSITAAQGTVIGSPNLIRGFGQDASSFDEHGMIDLFHTDQTTWGSPLLIASGSWTDVAPTFVHEQWSVLGVNVFRESTGIGTMKADVVTRINGSIVAPPPPPEPPAPDPVPVPPPVLAPINPLPPLPDPVPQPNPPPELIVEVDPSEPTEPDMPPELTIEVFPVDLPSLVWNPDWIPSVELIRGGPYLGTVIDWDGRFQHFGEGVFVAYDGDGRAMLNQSGSMHTTSAMGFDGALAAFLQSNLESQVPEPAMWCQALLAMMGVLAFRRFRR